MARREDFLRVQSVYMPREMLQAMGLFELPSQCIVNIAPFDTNLLEIDINDVERYAPEALVGRLMKGPDQIMKGSSRSLSNSGFQTSGKDWCIYIYIYIYYLSKKSQQGHLEPLHFRECGG